MFLLIRKIKISSDAHICFCSCKGWMRGRWRLGTCPSLGRSRSLDVGQIVPFVVLCLWLQDKRRLHSPVNCLGSPSAKHTRRTQYPKPNIWQGNHYFLCSRLEQFHLCVAYVSAASSGRFWYCRVEWFTCKNFLMDLMQVWDKMKLLLGILMEKNYVIK